MKIEERPKEKEESRVKVEASIDNLPKIDVLRSIEEDERKGGFGLGNVGASALDHSKKETNQGDRHSALNNFESEVKEMTPIKKAKEEI